jgi:predicted ATP-dependent serine protease
MDYICLDCSYRAKTKFPGGKCPACDSFNIRSANQIKPEKTRQEERKTLVEYFILILFWGVLLWGVWDRYLK